MFNYYFNPTSSFCCVIVLLCHCRVCTYQHENQWDKAVVSCDIDMSQSGQERQYDLLYVCWTGFARLIFIY